MADLARGGSQGRWQGTRDLTIFTTDNGAELNRGIYQIGRGLAADGTVDAWSGWVDVLYR